MRTLLVNVAGWETPPGGPVPDGWLIANAPRPLNGERAWTGPFRHGVLYAAMPAEPGDDGWDRERHAAILRSWESLDAWLVEFITDEQIRARVTNHLAASGYPPLEELESEGLTVGEIAVTSLGLPWHG